MMDVEVEEFFHNGTNGGVGPDGDDGRGHDVGDRRIVGFHSFGALPSVDEHVGLGDDSQGMPRLVDDDRCSKTAFGEKGRRLSDCSASTERDRPRRHQISRRLGAEDHRFHITYSYLGSKQLFPWQLGKPIPPAATRKPTLRVIFYRELPDGNQKHRISTANLAARISPLAVMVWLAPC
jgi:hypothetical protein